MPRNRFCVKASRISGRHLSGAFKIEQANCGGNKRQMKTTDEDKLLADFAAERSHRNSQVSNEHSRATAQAAIFINGGAATAVLAFLAKDKIDPFALRMIPIALGI